MPEPADVIAVVRQWVIKAENDLKIAAHGLVLGKECPTDAVCFHAQQCVEKYLKALLVRQGIDFAKTHEIVKLMALLPRTPASELNAREAERLTDYATATRYPGDYEEITLGEARRAVRMARRVRAKARRQLPRQALRR